MTCTWKEPRFNLSCNNCGSLHLPQSIQGYKWIVAWRRPLSL